MKIFYVIQLAIKTTIFLFILCAAPAFAQVPGDACATANAYTVSGGPEAAGKVYHMTCQGGVWVRITESDTAGNLGIRQAAPKAPLHVGGEAIIGDTGLGCTGTEEGAIRYTSSSDNWTFCNGSAWVPFEQAGCSPAAALAGHWTLNEVSTPSADSSASGNNGTWVNSPTSTTGKLGNALEFSGNTGSAATNDRVSIGDPADGSLDFGTGSFSYGFWVYITGNSGGFDMPWWKGSASAGAPGYDMELGTGAWKASIADGLVQLGSDFSAAPLLNQWVHLFAVVDRKNEEFRAYMDGAPITNTTIPSTFGSVANSYAATIGANSGGSFPLQGKVDDVKIYGCALTDAQVLALYNSYP